MPKRFCQCPGCPACNGQNHLFPTGQGPRCQACERHHDRARGTRQERGYDRNHELVREELLAQWQPGDRCAIGGEQLWDKSKLDLAHNATRTGYRGLACWDHNRGHGE